MPTRGRIWGLRVGMGEMVGRGILPPWLDDKQKSTTFVTDVLDIKYNVHASNARIRSKE
jgi:hypothetical protein